MDKPRHRTKIRTALATLGVFAVIAAACGNDSDDGAAVDEPADETGAVEPDETALADAPFEGDDFYEVPDPLPDGDPGTLLRFEPIDEYGGWNNFADRPDAFGIETLGSAPGGILIVPDPAAMLAGPDQGWPPQPDPEVGRSEDELAAWLTAHPELDVSDPESISVGGLDGLQLDIGFAPTSTSTTQWCHEGDVCVNLFSEEAPTDDSFGFGLGGRDDRARVILVTTGDGTMLITVDWNDFLGSDADAFLEQAEPLVDSIDFTDATGEPASGECPEPEFGGSCRGPLEPGTYTSTEFEPAFSYTVPEPLEDASAWRIMYLSESIQGEPIAVTGMALVPSVPPPESGRPIVSVAHGTTGIADECAPSLDPGFDLADQSRYVNEGYLVAFTDYEGLGTPGRHPYIVGESEGRGVLDAAKAARQLPDAEAGDQLAIWGHSQGGHAALWAAQLATEWAPELDLVGTVAAGVPADLPAGGEAIRSGLETDVVALGNAVMVVAGYEAAYPQVEPSWALTPGGEAELDVVDEGCADEVLGHFAGLEASELMQPADAVEEAWTALLEENNPGQVRVDGPILLVHGTEDPLPVQAVEEMHDRMCDMGQEVELQVIDGGDHEASWVKAFTDGFDWFQQRLAGDDPASTCDSP